MCGIAGSIPGGDGLRTVIDRQLATVRHRGPDAQANFGSSAGMIGQTRLAIIDLDTGDPPLTDESGRICAVLNGEIYNYRQLRRELELRGHTLRSAGDTEVLAHLAEELDGVDLARRLDGMFAFAIWDDRRRQLVLGRDRLGKKPLYYWYDAGRLVFGSEIKTVLAGVAVARAPNPRAIPAYLTFGYVPTPETFFEGILSVPPAHVLTFSAGTEPKLTRYWDLSVPLANGRPGISLRDAAGGVRSRLEAAVARRLISDVPLGAFLSGGVDSSAIVALMTRLSGSPVRTFTIGFDNADGLDERPFARLVARRYRTEHHEDVVPARAVDLVERLLWLHDQPFGDSSAVPMFLLSEVTRREVKVALSGDGGDELFAGYERFVAALALARYRRLPQAVRTMARAASGQLDPAWLGGRVESIQRFVRHADLPTVDAYRSWLSFLPEEDRQKALPEPDDWALREYAEIWSQSADPDLLGRLLRLNLQTYLVDDLLVKADRMSMASALEVRSPFLDVQLTEFAFQLPSRFKLSRFARKRVLAAAVADLVPRAILTRRKRGFAVPLDRWFRSDLKPLLDASLAPSNARIRRHVHGDLVDGLLSEHASGRRNRGQALWMLLMLELFMRREQW